MSKRITYTSIVNWIKNNKTISSLLIGVPSLLVMFSMLISFGIITVEDYNSNIHCGGEVECYLELINTCFKDDVFLYLNKSEAMHMIDSTPTDVIEDIRLYRSWGSGWRRINLEQGCTGTWCGKPKSDTRDYATYSYAFREDKCYDLRIEIDKPINSTVKWSINPKGEFSELEDDLYIGTIKLKDKIDKTKYIKATTVKPKKIKDDENIDSEVLDIYYDNGTLSIDLEVDKNYNMWLNISNNILFPIEYQVEKKNVLVTFNISIDNINMSQAEFHVGDESDIYVVDILSFSHVGQDYIWNDNMAKNATNVTKVVTDNLVGYWKLNENGNDALGFSNATLFGTVTNTTGHLGETNTALHFNGIDGYAEIPLNVAGLNFTTKATVSSWMKLDSTQTSFSPVSRWVGAKDDWSWYYSAGNYQFYANGALKMSYTKSLDLNQWIHLVWTYDGATFRMYYNGEEVDTHDEVTSITTDDDKIRIARNSGTNYLNGSVDDIRIYNRSLDKEEIKALYEVRNENQNNGSISYSFCIKDCINTTGLISQWKLNGNFSDSVGSNDGNNSGTINSTSCRYDDCMTFSDTSETYFTTPNINFTDFSISMWLKPKGYASGSAVIIYTSDLTLTDGLGMYRSSTSVMRFFVNNFNQADKYINFPFSTPEKDDVWSHILVTKDGVTGMNAYVNGVLVGNTPYLDDLVNTDKVIEWGKANGANYWEGEMDNIMIWNRSLSDVEVRKLYLSGYEEHIENASLQNVTFDGDVEVACYLSNITGDCDTRAISHWKLDGDSTDCRGAYDGNITSATSTTGIFNTAYDFDGNDATPNIIEFGDLSSSFDTEASITAWVKKNEADPAGPLSGIWNLGSAAANSHYTTGGEIYLGTFRSARVGGITPSTTVDRTTWHLLTITTKPGENGWKLYQNDELIYQTTGEATVSFAANSWIGYSNSDSFRYDGQFDDIRLYNYSLSEYEIWEILQNKFNTTKTVYSSGETINYNGDYGICEISGSYLSYANFTFAPYTSAVTPTVTNFQVSLENGSFTTEDTTPDIYFNATGTETTYSCTLYMNNTALGTNASVSNATSTYITVDTDRCEGNYTTYVNCTGDSVLNQSNSIFVFIDDVTAPTVTALVPTEGVTIDVDTAQEIAANISDCNLSLTTVTANVTHPGGEISVITLTQVDSTPKFNGTFPGNSTTGRYNVTIIADDGAGNINNTETTYFNVQILDRNLTATLCPSMGDIYFTPSIYNYDHNTGYLTQSDIYPDNNSDCGYTYNITNDVLGVPINVYAKNNVSYDPQSIYYADGTQLNTTYQTLFTLSVGESRLINLTNYVNVSLWGNPNGLSYYFNITFEGEAS